MGWRCWWSSLCWMLKDFDVWKLPIIMNSGMFNNSQLCLWHLLRRYSGVLGQSFSTYSGIWFCSENWNDIFQENLSWPRITDAMARYWAAAMLLRNKDRMALCRCRDAQGGKARKHDCQLCIVPFQKKWPLAYLCSGHLNWTKATVFVSLQDKASFQLWHWQRAQSYLRYMELAQAL
jgi:hypothetical protein